MDGGVCPTADAAGIIVDAIERADSANPAAIRSALASTRNYHGVVGTYRGFDNQGDVMPQWGSIVRFARGRWATLNPPASDIITPAGGSLLSYDERTIVTIPSGAIASTIVITHAPAYILPPVGNLVDIEQNFDLEAVDAATGAPAQPVQAYAIAVHYVEAELGPALENTLALYRWNGNRWIKEPTSTVNTSTNTVAASPTRFALFAVLGETRSVW